MNFILLYYEVMNIEGLRRSPRSLTLREKMWVENFRAHETPASLQLADEFVNSLRPSDVVLEVGCAFGRITDYLASKKKLVVVGVDINSAEIQYAKDNLTNPRVRFEVMDGSELDFPDNSFDVVVMLGVVGGVELEVRKNLLKEAHRVIKPGGAVAIAEFKMNLDDPDKVKKYEDDMKITGEWGSRIVKKGSKILFVAKHFTEEELINLLSDAGFSLIELREQTIEVAGIGDGIVEKRKQYNAWGVKALK